MATIVAAIVAAIAGIVLLAGGVLRSGPAATKVQAHDAASAEIAPARESSPPNNRTGASARIVEAGNSVSADVAMPPSLRGTQPDGAVQFDAAGRLVIDHSLRLRFDYWLTGLGEVSLEALRERLQHSLLAELEPGQVQRVLAEFDLYAEYLQAADDLLPTTFGSPRERHLALIELQRQLLGESRSAAWFGEQNRYIDRTLAALEGHPPANDLTEDPWADEIHDATRHHSALAPGTPQVRETLSPEALDAQRRRRFGEAAADRLAALDTRRAQWDDRLNRFVQARMRLLEHGGADVGTELNALLEQSFDPAEQRRVLALLDAGLLPSGGDG